MATTTKTPKGNDARDVASRHRNKLKLLTDANVDVSRLYGEAQTCVDAPFKEKHYTLEIVHKVDSYGNPARGGASDDGVLNFYSPKEIPAWDVSEHPLYVKLDATIVVPISADNFREKTVLEILQADKHVFLYSARGDLISNDNYATLITNRSTYVDAIGDDLAYTAAIVSWILITPEPAPKTSSPPPPPANNLRSELEKLLKTGLEEHTITVYGVEDPSIPDEKIKTKRKNFYKIIKLLEGLYVNKTKGIGDIVSPVYVSLASMRWVLKGYKHVSERVCAELAALKRYLKKNAKDIDTLIALPERHIEIAQCLNAQLSLAPYLHAASSDRAQIFRAEREVQIAREKLLE